MRGYPHFTHDRAEAWSSQHTCPTAENAQLLSSGARTEPKPSLLQSPCESYLLGSAAPGGRGFLKMSHEGAWTETKESPLNPKRPAGQARWLRQPKQST